MELLKCIICCVLLFINVKFLLKGVKMLNYIIKEYYENLDNDKR